MKNIKYYLCSLLAATAMSSCDTDFEEINRNPDSVYEVDPKEFFYKVEFQMYTAGEAWSDSYALKLRWMQYCAGIWGYSTTNFTACAGFGRDLYKNYNEVGSYARHIPYYIEQNLPEMKESYAGLIEAARILLITKGIQTSDTYGSLVYTDGWGYRSGQEIEEPKFQTQEKLYTLWNEELKAAAEKLSTLTNQESFQTHDVAYSGDIKKWGKAANALRLRIALRLWKQRPEVAKSIASEVLNSGNIFEGIDDSFILYFDNYWTTLGDWHSVIDMDRASIPFMTYLKKYNDPRKRLYFQINNLTPENIAAYNASDEATEDKKIPEGLSRWEGGHVSYDSWKSDVNRTPRYLRIGKEAIDMRPMNRPQTRLWKGAQDEGAAGGWVPLVTYADFCFMAAEFTLDGVKNIKSAQEWYEEGVKSSIRQWSNIGKYCQINEYEAVSDEEIEEFLAQEGIAWNPDKAKEQIYCQSFVEHFKNNNETWAMYKRVNYPSTDSELIKWEEIYANGELQKVPRRYKFRSPVEGSANYANEQKRLEDMAKEPGFGLFSDEFGRVWWDKE